MRPERIEGKIKPILPFRFFFFLILYWNSNNSFSRVCKKFHKNLFLILHLCHILKIIPSVLLYHLDWKTEYVRIIVSDQLGKSLKNVITKSDRAQFLFCLFYTGRENLKVVELFTSVWLLQRETGTSDPPPDSDCSGHNCSPQYITL